MTGDRWSGDLRDGNKGNSSRGLSDWAEKSPGYHKREVMALLWILRRRFGGAIELAIS